MPDRVAYTRASLHAVTAGRWQFQAGHPQRSIDNLKIR
jgi:hypothetical protein